MDGSIVLLVALFLVAGAPFLLAAFLVMRHRRSGRHGRPSGAGDGSLVVGDSTTPGTAWSGSGRRSGGAADADRDSGSRGDADGGASDGGGDGGGGGGGGD